MRSTTGHKAGLPFRLVSVSICSICSRDESSNGGSENDRVYASRANDEARSPIVDGPNSPFSTESPLNQRTNEGETIAPYTRSPRVPSLRALTVYSLNALKSVIYVILLRPLLPVAVFTWIQLIETSGN